MGNIKETDLAQMILKAYAGIRVSLANEIADVCDHLNLDSNEILGSVWASQFPGGFGPRISEAMEELLRLGRGTGTPMELMDAALAINWERPFRVVDTVRMVLGDLKGKKVIVFGGNGDSPIVRELTACGAEVVKEGGECLVVIEEPFPVIPGIPVVFAQVLRE